MAKVEQEPLSRERFENNADKLIFPNRHEYRTRSRVVHFVYGSLAVLMLAALVGVLVWAIFFLAPTMPPPVDSQIRTIGYIFGPLSTAASPFLIWLALFGFFFRPRLIVSPDGIDFLEWMPVSFRFRLINFRVDFADVTAIDIYTRGEAGQRGNPASTFRYGVQLYAEGQYDLKLPWTAYEQDEAARFMAAFVSSVQEMANRNLHAPFR